MQLFKRKSKKTAQKASYIKPKDAAFIEFVKGKDERKHAAKLFAAPHFFTVLDYYAKSFAQIPIIETRNGKKIESSNNIDVFLKPHPLLTSTEYKRSTIKQLLAWHKLYLYFTNSILPGTGNSLVLPANKIEKKRKILSFNDLISADNKKEIFEYFYHYNDGDKNIRIKLDADYLVELELESNLDLFGTESKIDIISDALMADREVSSALNTLISKRGALGILSNKPKTDMAAAMFDEDQKKDIQNELTEYGLNPAKYQLIITSASLDFQRIALPPMELVPPEIQEKIKNIIYDVLNFPAQLLNSDSGSVFDSGEKAKVIDQRFYNDSIKPYATMISEALTEFVLGSNANRKIEFDFQRLPAMQQSFIDNQNNLKVESENLIKLNDAIKNGTMKREQVLFLLENSGYDKEIANKLI